MSPIPFIQRACTMGRHCFFYLENSRQLMQEECIGEAGKRLVQLSSLAIPLPPGMIITKQTAKEALSFTDFLKGFVKHELTAGLHRIDAKLTESIGHKRPGKLFSLRSLQQRDNPFSRAYSFDFIGLSEKNVADFEPFCPDGKAIYLNFLRTIKDLSSFVFHISKHPYQTAWEHIKKNEGALIDSDVTTEGLHEACLHFLHIFKKEAGRSFPSSLEEQFDLLLSAIYHRWQTEVDDPLNNLIGRPRIEEPELMIQCMVFSNLSAYSGQGTLYSRNPTNGNPELYGDYFQKRGSEDIFDDHTSTKRLFSTDLKSLQYLMPSVFQEIVSYSSLIEKELQETTRVDFTIEDGHLFITNITKGDEQPLCTIKSLSEMFKKDLINSKTLLKRIHPQQALKAAEQLDTLQQQGEKCLIESMEAPSAGVAIGKLVLSNEMAEKVAKEGGMPILLKEDDSEVSGFENDLSGVIALKGIKTSYFFQRLRLKNIPSIILGEEVLFDKKEKALKFPEGDVHEGDLIAFDTNQSKLFKTDTPSNITLKRRGSSGLFEPLKLMADHLKSLTVFPILSVQDLNHAAAELKFLDLESLVQSTLEEHPAEAQALSLRENRALIRSAIKNKLASSLYRRNSTHPLFFLFPKTDNLFRQFFSKQSDERRLCLDSLGKRERSWEAALPLIESAVLAISDCLKETHFGRNILLFQDIRSREQFIKMHKTLTEKLKTEGHFPFISTLEFGLSISPYFLPADFEMLMREVSFLFLDGRDAAANEHPFFQKTSQEETKISFEILKIIMKAAKGGNPLLQTALLANNELALPFATFAEENGVNYLVCRQEMVDPAAIAAAKTASAHLKEEPKAQPLSEKLAYLPFALD